MEIEFTTFKLSSSDWLTIRDGNGSILMDKKYGDALPPKIWTHTNVVQFEFVTNSYGTSTGWRATWTAVAPAVCQTPWILLGNRCYMFLMEGMTWYGARAACKERSGYLVEVDSDEENNLLIAEIKRRGWVDGWFWIGLNSEEDFGWRWSQYKRRPSFTKFSNKFLQTWVKEKSKPCGALDRENEWNAWYCDFNLHSICEMQ